MKTKAFVWQQRLMLSVVMAVLFQVVGCQPSTNTTSQQELSVETGQETVAFETAFEEPHGPSALTPVMRADDLGGVHLAWMESTPETSSILYSQWNDGHWSPPASVSDDQTAPLFPEIAVTPRGQVHVTWIERVENDADVFHSALFDGKWTSPTKVCDTDGISQRPQIAVGVDGTAHIVWYDNSGGNFELFYSYLSESGWSEAKDTQLVNLLVTHDPGMGMIPGLAIDQGGNAHVVYVNLGRGVMDLFHSWWDGTAWSEQESITGYTAPTGKLRTFTDPKGVGHIAREGEQPPKPSQPEIEIDASGNIHVAWENRGEVWYSKWDRQNWSAPYRLTDGAANSLWPVLRLAPTGEVHVTWTSSVSGTSQIFYRQFGEAWGEAIQVTSTPVESAFSALAIDRSGELHFAWMEDSNGSYDIVHQIGLAAEEVNLVSSKR